ncbi:phage tail sheath C-terminal domain-containing protein [Aequorivita todarodis]|uniref:phage tail sheath family protein n=1 Tax=Aequorivita todarodis TaxID=2036821 RepID=UPI00234FF32F|nr:phage tail sheath C-terminal domain-containing protein [Aequorivita todarodis]MDC7999606.1 phage tail sheath C-terminal domain-containing protein [Aequorivita todarodis]
MGKKTYKTPGVYVEEVSAFPSSVAAVETAIPAFIGYTPQADLNGNDCTFVPTKITSFLEFQHIFGFPDSPEPVQQYSPQYYLVRQNSKPKEGDFILIGSEYYSIVPDAHSIYYLYNSVKLFYQNGGGKAYIVSVGGYGKTAGTPLQLGAPLVNPNVQLADLLKGVQALKKKEEVSMYICPEATLLPLAENGTLMQQMLLQNSEMRTAISIFDIIGGNRENPLGNDVDIEAFRNHTGATGLGFGAAYYPFVGTTMMGERDLNYTNLFGGDVRKLATVLNSTLPPEERVLELLKAIYNSENSGSISENHRELLYTSTTYRTIISAVLKCVNLLPSSGGMAGIITRVDNTRGVWKAPANVSMAGVASLPIQINNTEQQGLNVDAISGKSINALRNLAGRGILVWGARTLAGNDNEWRYINVRRTMIFIEQSCKNACKGFVFEPNDANTWVRIQGMIENFLNSLWRQGGLAGATPKDAYFVKCGLGTTMTTNDILDGRLIVNIGVALIRPAEFMIISFSQQQMVSP